MHKFNPENHKRLDSDERYELMPPELLADEIEKTALNYFKSGDAVKILKESGFRDAGILPLYSSSFTLTSKK